MASKQVIRISLRQYGDQWSEPWELPVIGVGSDGPSSVQFGARVGAVQVRAEFTTVEAPVEEQVAQPPQR